MKFDRTYIGSTNASKESIDPVNTNIPEWINERGEHFHVNPDTGEYICTTPPAWSLPISERMQSGRKNKDGTPRKYGWEQMYRVNTDRRPVCQGDNINFICQYLYENPGARYTAILRALCENNRVSFNRGQYSTYLNPRDIRVNGWPWQRCGRGWMLTPIGMVRAVDSRKTPDYNANKFPGSVDWPHSLYQ